MAKRRTSRHQAGPSKSPNPAPKSSASPPRSSGDFQKTLFLCAFLFIATLWTFSPALKHGFVNYDDDAYVTGNPVVQAGLTMAGVKWAFTTTQANNWHPVTWLSHMLDCQLYGLDAKHHHLTSLVLHALNAALLFLLFKRMTGAVGRSLFVALIFALHPLHVESVAWIAERKDVLSTLFWMLTTWAYLAYVDGLKKPGSRRAFWYAAALLFFAAGLLAKPMLVTLPFVLLLLDYWPLRRLEAGIRKLLVEKIPFLLLALASCCATLIAQREAMSVSDELPFSGRSANAIVSCSRYLAKLLCPADLAVIYPHPDHWPVSTVVVSAFLVLSLTALGIALRGRYAWLAVGWFWYLGTLVPVIGLVQVGSQSIADRYMYVPSIGLLIIVAWGGWELLRRSPNGLRISCVTGAALGVACILATERQLGYWNDSVSLFGHALAVTDLNWVAHNNLGGALQQQGHFPDAAEEYEKSIKINPRNFTAHNNLGGMFDYSGNLNDAAHEYREAIRVNPNYAVAHNNLGHVLDRVDRLDEAISEYQIAIRLNPGFAVMYDNLGSALERKGRIDEAIIQYQNALRLNPAFADAQASLQRAETLRKR